MSVDNKRVCPVENSFMLDNFLRKWLQNPKKYLKKHIKEGMTVLDLGCGPGFLTVPLARMVGPSGKVIAADLQKGMLEKIASKIRGTELENRIKLHLCGSSSTGINGKADFLVIFYMAHEHPDVKALFKEAFSLLNPGGQMLVVEPVFHVSQKDFNDSVDLAIDAGFLVKEKSATFMDRIVLLENRASGY